MFLLSVSSIYQKSIQTFVFIDQQWFIETMLHSNFAQFVNYFLFVSMLFRLNFVHGFLKTAIAGTVFQFVGTTEEALVLPTSPDFKFPSLLPMSLSISQRSYAH